MPYRLERPCRNRQCPNTTGNADGYCQECRDARENNPRESAASRGYDRRWQEFRLRYLRKNPICVDCIEKHKKDPLHRIKPATEIHHTYKLRDYPDMQYTEKYLMALCKKCHSKRTMRGE